MTGSKNIITQFISSVSGLYGSKKAIPNEITKPNEKKSLDKPPNFPVISGGDISLINTGPTS